MLFRSAETIFALLIVVEMTVGSSGPNLEVEFVFYCSVYMCWVRLAKIMYTAVAIVVI